MLDACKWDPQIGDVSTIADFPLLMGRDVWHHLASIAERLSRELLDAEEELFQRPELHGTLGLPWQMRWTLRRARAHPRTPVAARLLRFDFHWTTDGWRVSEVNSDVPGGFSEAIEIARRFARFNSGAAPAGDPASLWLDAIAARAQGDAIGLLAAPGYMEDQQVLAYLSMGLARRGLHAVWPLPQHLVWVDDSATIHGRTEPLGAILRFYQAEWLCARDFRRLCFGGRTPVTNPVWTSLTESKRLPLLWPRLRTPMRTWGEHLPETVDPRDVETSACPRWVIKPAFGNTGDDVSIHGIGESGDREQAVRRATRNPGRWVAQRRFTAVPMSTPDGPMYPCIGVYTIDGRAGGIYARLSPRPLIDFASIDVGVLIEDHRV